MTGVGTASSAQLSAFVISWRAEEQPCRTTDRTRRLSRLSVPCPTVSSALTLYVYRNIVTSMSTETRLTVRECMRCHHRWLPRQSSLPRQCPKCHSPYWQTPRQYSKRGRPKGVRLIGGQPELKHHRTWGKWRLNKKPPYPSLDFPMTEWETYEIPLSRCGTPRARELWLQQMATKGHITSADLGDLARALLDLMRQGEIPVGLSKRPLVAPNRTLTR